MPRRETEDGGHTVFTDHRIRKTPEQPAGTAPLTELIAWREPALEFRERNLALALNNAGLHYSSLDLLERDSDMFLEIQKKFPADPDVLGLSAPCC
jgi:hypothetical protein